MKKILVIGSGPIVIGQAAEFDYAGTQACKSLREEGYQVVLINSNPATIMTDEETADRVYIEPLTVEFCERVIARERPEGLLPTLGGQTGLNLASQLAEQGILEKYGVRLLGTQLDAIRKAEDRELFRALMREIKQPVPESWIVESDADLEALLDVVPYPCIVRPAYTLGGTGGGVVHTREELWETGRKGLKLSMRSQIMLERSLLGWKEVEYEVMRDRVGNCITVCNMENLDPMGVHTGDSIVVAPSQTLSDVEYHMLRNASLRIIEALKIEGGCNVQLAVNPDSFDYYVIEVNPRVSRSSALASKATGYPIARVAAKIAVGKTLDEIENAVTKTTRACFEPALDYVVVKIPRWPFDKFPGGDRRLSTQMKATGEVMAIDRTLEAALLKAIRGLEVKAKGLDPWHPHPGDGVPAFQAGGAGIREDRPIAKRRGATLPHWTQEGAVYHVVFRLADSLPQEVVERFRSEWLQLVRQEQAGDHVSRLRILDEKRRYSERLERHLDQGTGECHLRRPEVARLVESALLFFEGQRTRLHAWCVMPNHVHAIVEPLPDHTLSDVLHSWKSYTANQANALLGRSGAFWQTESYDRLIRDDREYSALVDYVLANPPSAGLSEWPFVGLRLPDGSFARGEETQPGRLGHHPQDGDATDPLAEELVRPTDERLWAIAEAFRQGWSVEEVNRVSRVDPWFLRKIEGIVRAGSPGHHPQDGEAPGGTVYKMVDTCAGEFESHTPYYYATDESEDDASPVLTVGSPVAAVSLE